MRIGVNRKSQVPLYRQLADQLVLEIVSGRLDAGKRLPGTRALAGHAGVDTSVAEAAYRALEKEGWVKVKDRVGVFVSPKGQRLGKTERVRRVVKKAEELLREAQSMGFSAREALRIAKITAQESGE